MGILDTPAYSRAQADRRFSVSARNTFAVIGDSFQQRSQTTSGTIGTNNSYTMFDANKGFVPWLQAFLGGRLRLVSNTAIGGTNTTQWIANGQVTTTVALTPAWCLVGAPTNDREQEFAIATTKANMTSIFDSLAAAGVKIVAMGLTPRSAMTAAQQAFTVDYNIWLRTLNRPNFYVADPFRQLTNGGTSGTWVDASSQKWTQEGLHPMSWACARMARVAADVMAPVVPYLDPRPSGGLDFRSSGAASPNILLDAGLVDGTAGTVGKGGTGTIASNFTLTSSDGANFAGAVAASIVAATDQTSLPWQQLACTGSASKPRVNQTGITTGFTPGTSKIRAEVELDMDADLSGATKLALGVQVNLTAGGFFESRWDWTPLTGDFPVENRLTKDKDGHYPVIFTPTVDIPAGASSVSWYFEYNGLGTVRFRSPALRINPTF
jgi:hypothetical protein